VRFLANGAIVVQASICWQCNNIYGYGLDGARELHAFDASAAPAQELLSALERATLSS
jgi:hypothetical protein